MTLQLRHTVYGENFILFFYQSVSGRRIRKVVGLEGEGAMRRELEWKGAGGLKVKGQVAGVWAENENRRIGGLDGKERVMEGKGQGKEYLGKR
jgi:hypothetical protein